MADRNTPKYRFFDNPHLDLIPSLKGLDPKTLSGLRLASRVFPFKVNSYVVENLIDWSAAPDDPIYRLVFPHHDMLLPQDAAELSRLIEGDAGATEVDRTVRRIRREMNPHASGQLHNRPHVGGVPIEGIQHKYTETALYFPKQGQTCHAYCTFCFRWPQFVETDVPRFEGREVAILGKYLAANPGISDLLLTGGDPMIMNARRLEAYVDLIMRPEFVHIQTVRFGTKALSWWPFRFFAEEDSEALLGLLSRLVDAGKHVAIMAHIDHWREMEQEPFEIAVAALRRTGAVIRSQAPVLRNVNADADVLAPHVARPSAPRHRAVLHVCRTRHGRPSLLLDPLGPRAPNLQLGLLTALRAWTNGTRPGHERRCGESAGAGHHGVSWPETFRAYLSAGAAAGTGAGALSCQILRDSHVAGRVGTPRCACSRGVGTRTASGVIDCRGADKSQAAGNEVVGEPRDLPAAGPGIWAGLTPKHCGRGSERKSSADR